MANFLKSFAKGFGGLLGHIPVVGGALSGAVDSLIGESDNRENFRRQQQLLSQQQNFNASEAQKQRDFTQQSIESARAYNDPSAQMSRLTSAGLNPNLVAGSMGGAGLSEASTGGTASASSPGLSAPMLDPSLQLANAQSRLINAQADKVEEDTGVVHTYQEFQRDILSGTVKMQSATFEYSQALTRLSREQQKTLWHYQDQMNQNISNLKQEFKILSAETSIKEIQASWEHWIQAGNWHKLESESELNKENASNVSKFAEAALTNAFANWNNVENQRDYWKNLGRELGVDASVAEASFEALKSIIDSQGQMLKINLKNLDDLGKIQIVSEIVKNFGLAVGSFMSGARSKKTNVQNGSTYVNNW